MAGLVPTRLRRMTPRDAHDPERVASPLELLFDLVFVVAVSFASRNLYLREAEGDLGAALGAYLMVFFAIWWAWMNFTWFASAFDTDDWLYRLTTIVQMAGVLVLAAGVEDVMVHGDFVLVTVGYVIMRLAMVGQWVRLALSSPEYRATAVRFAVGITVVQVLWVLRLTLPDAVSVETFVVLAVAEVLVPVVGERAGGTPWHPHHIAERYGLFTMILLGESLLASANAIIEGLHEADHTGPLLVLSASTLVIVAGMWWVYFAVPHRGAIGALPYLLSGTLFAAAGAVSAGVEVAVAHELGHSGLGDVGVAATLTVPVALFLLSVWWLGIRRRVRGRAGAIVPAGAVVVAVATVTPVAAVVTAVTLVAVVVGLVALSPRGASAPVTPPVPAAR